LKNEEISKLDKESLLKMEKIKSDSEIEKLKIRQKNLETQELYRWQSKNELFQDRIVEAINNLKPITPPKFDCINQIKTNSTALLCLSDFHAGSTYEIKGLYNEVVNKYDFDIMKSRLWELLRKIEDDDLIYDNMVIAILGDCFENILRISSLQKLREPVIDTVIKFSEFMANWIIEIQQQLLIPINIVTIGGNHDNIRPLNSKNQLEGENLTKLVVEFLKLRLKDCTNIKVDDYTEVAVKTIRNVNIMFEHGEDKDLETTMSYFENLYNVTVDEIIAGHLHRPETSSVGISEFGDKQITRVGSICGIDPHAKKIRKAARPSAYFAIYDENNGKTWSRNYYL
jgi:predicted phosphodiesterase